MQAYLNKRPAQLAAFIAEQRRFAKLGAAPASAYKLFDMDFAGLEQRIRAAPPATWGMNAPRLKPRAFYSAGYMMDALPPVSKPTLSAVDRLVSQVGGHGMLDWAEHAHGFKYLGSGCYATAWEHPDLPDRVIKVGRSTHDGWLGYAKWCVANQGKPMVPKIYELRRIEGVAHVAYIAVIEKLQPLTMGHSVANYQQRRAMNAYWDEQVEGLERFINNDLAERYVPDSRALEAAGRMLHAAFGPGGTDLHRGNVMMRDNGQLVITDPYIQSDGTTTKDLPA